jgi:inositol 2-dehydrogenase
MATPIAEINIGIIGAGRIGQVHLKTLSQCPFANVIILGDLFIEGAQQQAAKFGVPVVTDTIEEVINHPDVQAVWICSPSQFHAQQIMQCADAGKHVFCEKPIDTSVSGTLQAIQYAETKGIKLMTALQRRFDTNFLRVKAAIDSKEIGEPIQLKLTSRDPSPPPFEYVRGGGGIFKDMAIHDLDMARFLMGCEPSSVLAIGSCHFDKRILELDGPEAFDTAVIIVKFSNGASATVDVCRNSPYGYDQRAEFLGSKGCIQIENMHPNTAKLWTSSGTGNADPPHDFFMTRYAQAYTDESVAFAAAVANNEPPPITGNDLYRLNLSSVSGKYEAHTFLLLCCAGHDGLMALVMAEAAGRSAMTGQWEDVALPPCVGTPK